MTKTVGGADASGRCGRRCPGFDAGRGRRRWRALDLGPVRVVIEADAPRVSCPVHGVVVAAVPWARHDAGHTRVLDDTVAWLAPACAKNAVPELMRIPWRTVGSIVARVWADGGGAADRLARMRRIGIDEISFQRGHKYLTIVVDHDSGRLLRAYEGRDSKPLDGFFDALGEQRAAQLTHVSADAAEWIASVVARCAPTAIRCADVHPAAPNTLPGPDRRGHQRLTGWRGSDRAGHSPRGRRVRGAGPPLRPRAGPQVITSRPEAPKPLPRHSKTGPR